MQCNGGNPAETNLNEPKQIQQAQVNQTRPKQSKSTRTKSQHDTTRHGTTRRDATRQNNPTRRDATRPDGAIGGDIDRDQDQHSQQKVNKALAFRDSDTEEAAHPYSIPHSKTCYVIM